ncbi:hypothetical protein D9757_005641 [Collybiopsis confluens]|uniref:Uncharacterized protein n=1 Tax=Collybiopsis confluens TaxID=2823264 RepID=A0A8H5HSX0_9AGAR|nr:hypothetical protein D9757_005641 [Collybiopsis confluens]
MEGDYVGERPYQLAAYLRFASISMALYDIFESAPRTWKYTREQWNAPQITLSFLLFLLIQFISIAAISLSNFGFFYSHFTQRLCDHYFLVPPICKVLQSVVSQVILGFRAFNLSKRSKPVGWLLLIILIATTTMEGLTTLQHRTPFVDPVHPGLHSRKIDALGAWTYYAVVIIYDLTTTLICMFYLLKYKPISDPSFAKVTRMMFYDGIGYFTALTAVNILNLVLFRASLDIQTAASSLGYAAIWIMAKRLIIHLHVKLEISLQRRQGSFGSRSNSDRSVSEMIETPYGPKSPSASLELTIPDFDIDGIEAETDWEDQTPHFQVEKIVQIERRARPVYPLEEDSSGGDFS